MIGVTVLTPQEKIKIDRVMIGVTVLTPQEKIKIDREKNEGGVTPLILFYNI
ncbi:hypothetical protein HMPREF9225_0092 [Peptoniphilus duerdenii ATCC BAA-1640]|uniref:Uncharacterized protein n=1 Tax=Peptoniphilus duerdenii ATCC BAA-1640 TaxID=862517 RepID=E0NIV3_9FIRM|nr:hypothetical protein HMPREF9225_0092 [Peptoniphilus duerdenii ATCC BAA-1640]